MRRAALGVLHPACYIRHATSGVLRYVRPDGRRARLDWASVRPFVSGAQRQAMSMPTADSANDTHITHGAPKRARPIGSANVPAAAPMRLIAVTTPAAVARTCVGKHSAG